MDRVKVPPARPTWVRVLCFPATVLMFYRVMKTLPEPHPWRAAFGFAKLTVRRRT